MLWLLFVSSMQSAEFSVDSSGHHLQLNNQPFFWLADTSWLLAQVPSRDDLELYLTTRKQQGFSVIQFTAVMSEERVWGTTRTNIFGQKPFHNDAVCALVERFVAKGRFTNWMKGVALRIALEPRAALLGAAHSAVMTREHRV